MSGAAWVRVCVENVPKSKYHVLTEEDTRSTQPSDLHLPNKIKPGKYASRTCALGTPRQARALLEGVSMGL